MITYRPIIRENRIMTHVLVRPEMSLFSTWIMSRYGFSSAFFRPVDMYFLELMGLGGSDEPLTYEQDLHAYNNYSQILNLSEHTQVIQHYHTHESSVVHSAVQKLFETYIETPRLHFSNRSLHATSVLSMPVHTLNSLRYFNDRQMQCALFTKQQYLQLFEKTVSHHEYGSRISVFNKLSALESATQMPQAEPDQSAQEPRPDSRIPDAYRQNEKHPALLSVFDWESASFSFAQLYYNKAYRSSFSSTRRQMRSFALTSPTMHYGSLSTANYLMYAKAYASRYYKAQKHAVPNAPSLFDQAGAFLPAINYLKTLQTLVNTLSKASTDQPASLNQLSLSPGFESRNTQTMKTVQSTDDFNSLRADFVQNTWSQVLESLTDAYTSYTAYPSVFNQKVHRISNSTHTSEENAAFAQLLLQQNDFQPSRTEHVIYQGSAQSHTTTSYAEMASTRGLIHEIAEVANRYLEHDLIFADSAIDEKTPASQNSSDFNKLNVFDLHVVDTLVQKLNASPDVFSRHDIYRLLTSSSYTLEKRAMKSIENTLNMHKRLDFTVQAFSHAAASKDHLFQSAFLKVHDFLNILLEKRLMQHPALMGSDFVSPLSISTDFTSLLSANALLNNTAGTQPTVENAFLNASFNISSQHTLGSNIFNHSDNHYMLQLMHRVQLENEPHLYHHQHKYSLDGTPQVSQRKQIHIIDKTDQQKQFNRKEQYTLKPSHTQAIASQTQVYEKALTELELPAFNVFEFRNKVHQYFEAWAKDEVQLRLTALQASLTQIESNHENLALKQDNKALISMFTQIQNTATYCSIPADIVHGILRHYLHQTAYSEVKTSLLETSIQKAVLGYSDYQSLSKSLNFSSTLNTIIPLPISESLSRVLTNNSVTSMRNMHTDLKYFNLNRPFVAQRFAGSIDENRKGVTQSVLLETESLSALSVSDGLSTSNRFSSSSTFSDTYYGMILSEVITGILDKRTLSSARTSFQNDLERRGLLSVHPLDAFRKTSHQNKTILHLLRNRTTENVLTRHAIYRLKGEVNREITNKIKNTQDFKDFAEDTRKDSRRDTRKDSTVMASAVKTSNATFVNESDNNSITALNKDSVLKGLMTQDAIHVLSTSYLDASSKTLIKASRDTIMQTIHTVATMQLQHAHPRNRRENVRSKTDYKPDSRKGASDHELGKAHLVTHTSSSDARESTYMASYTASYTDRLSLVFNDSLYETLMRKTQETLNTLRGQAGEISGRRPLYDHTRDKVMTTAGLYPSRTILSSTFRSTMQSGVTRILLGLKNQDYTELQLPNTIRQQIERITADQVHLLSADILQGIEPDLQEVVNQITKTAHLGRVTSPIALQTPEILQTSDARQISKALQTIETLKADETPQKFHRTLLETSILTQGLQNVLTTHENHLINQLKRPLIHAIISRLESNVTTANPSFTRSAKAYKTSSEKHSQAYHESFETLSEVLESHVNRELKYAIKRVSLHSELYANRETSQNTQIRTGKKAGSMNNIHLRTFFDPPQTAAFTRYFTKTITKRRDSVQAKITENKASQLDESIGPVMTLETHEIPSKDSVVTGKETHMIKRMISSAKAMTQMTKTTLEEIENRNIRPVQKNYTSQAQALMKKMQDKPRERPMESIEITSTDLKTPEAQDIMQPKSVMPEKASLETVDIDAIFEKIYKKFEKRISFEKRRRGL